MKIKPRPTLHNLLTTSLFILFVFAATMGGRAQVYYHNFGTTTITTKPYTGIPTTFDPNLSGSSWTTSAAAFAGLAGNGGAPSQSLSLNNSSGSPTFTLTFNVSVGYQLSVTSFNFWRVRSNTGAQNWSMTINGTSVGSGTIPTTGAMLGQTNVSNAISGLTGTITIIYTMSGASGTGTCRLDDFTLNGSVTPTGNVIPTVTTQDVSTIGTSAATGNGNITYTGGVDPTARGFCWDLATNADPDINDTKVEESPGPFSTGSFTGSITGLSPGIMYKERAYATNSEGTGYGNVVNFFTLSVEPQNHALVFTAAATSQAQIDLTFSAPGSIPNAAGYLVLQKTGSAPTGSPADATGYSLGNTLGDGTVAAIVTSLSATTVSITGLTPGTVYYFTLFPYNWDGTNAATYNYLTDLPVPGANALTNPPNDATSYVDAPLVQANPVSISSLSDTDPEAVEVFRFKINDVGVDGLATKVTKVTIGAGANNNANWSATILGAKLSANGGVTFITTGSVVISASSVVFTVASGNLDIANGQNVTVSLFIYLKTSGLTDNKILEFNIPATAHGFTADVTGSTFLTSFLNATTSAQTLVDVDASILNFVQQPTNVGFTPQTISPAVTISANDANGNRDLDYVTGVSVTANGAILVGTPVTGIPVNGLSTFGTLSFTAVATGVTLDASSGTLTGATSTPFNVVLLPASGEIVINQFSPDYGGASNEYVELLNKTNKTFDLADFKIEYQSTSGGTGTAGGALSGTLGPYQYWLLSPDATITVGQTTAMARDGAITSGFGATNAQLALRLKNAPNTIIDGLAYGTVTNNNLGEGAAASNPPTDGGLVRVPDGSDSNVNSSDFTTVSKANIYLRNHNSYNFSNTCTLPSTSYLADVLISGASTAASLSGSTTVNGKLTILAGALSIAANQSLSVIGPLTNSAGPSSLVVKSDATGTGSLIHNTTGVEGTFERYMTDADWNNWQDGWHFLSSPVANQEISTFTSTPESGYDFYCWYEPSNIWVNYKNNSAPPTWNTANGSTAFTVGKGYMVAYDAAQVKSFSGQMNVESVTKTDLPYTPLTYAGTDVDPGWNLLGNPFSSAITWKTSGWLPQNIAAVAKIWNEALSSYTDIDSAMIIPATQGFMVNATSGTNSLTITAAARTHSAQPWYKSTQNPYIKLVAHNLEAQTAQESVVIFNSQATPGYSPYFDSHFLPGYAPSFYSLDGTENLSTNVLQAMDDQTAIPFSFIKTDGSNYSIEAALIDHVPAQVYLTDLKNSQTQNLTENPMYHFTAMDGDDPARFLLFFSHVGIGENIPAGNGIYAYSNNLCLVNPGKARLEVYSLTGQKLKTEEVNSPGLYKTNLDGPTGYYIVRLIKGTKVEVVKVFIRS